MIGCLSQMGGGSCFFDMIWDYNAAVETIIVNLQYVRSFENRCDNVLYHNLCRGGHTPAEVCVTLAIKE